MVFAIQRYEPAISIHICPPFWASLPPIQGITENQAEFPVLWQLSTSYLCYFCRAYSITQQAFDLKHNDNSLLCFFFFFFLFFSFLCFWHSFQVRISHNIIVVDQVSNTAFFRYYFKVLHLWY